MRFDEVVGGVSLLLAVRLGIRFDPVEHLVMIDEFLRVT